MKLYEWFFYAVLIALIYAGLIVYAKVDAILGIACFVAAGVLSVSCLYIAKLRPLLLARQAFLSVAARNGFIGCSGKPKQKHVSGYLRDFPGFGDVYLGVDDLHTMQNESGTFYAGRYALSGSGLNFGYFMLGILRVCSSGESLLIDRIHDDRDGLQLSDETSLDGLPWSVQDALRVFPYDFHFRNNLFLADFDARRLCEQNFAESFGDMIDVLSTLADASSASNGDSMVL
jgi:hypothetical protein